MAWYGLDLSMAALLSATHPWPEKNTPPSNNEVQITCESGAAIFQTKIYLPTESLMFSMKSTFALIFTFLMLVGCSASQPEYADVGEVYRISPEFDQLISPNTYAKKLAERFEWAEGPVWIERKDAKGLIFTDIPRNRVVLWLEHEDPVTLIHPAGYTGNTNRGGEMGANGLAFDANQNLILCQHGDRRLAMLKREDQVSGYRKIKFETLVDNYNGKKFNSPNDLIIKSNGDIYFTDPPYGLEGYTSDPKRELDFQGVYRLTKDKKLTLLTKELTRPNGIAFSPDEKTLYVSNSDSLRAIWMAYPVNPDGTIGKGKVFYDATAMVKEGKQGLPDGMKVDQKGNIWATGPGGVLVFSPAGKLLGVINVGKVVANVAFGNDGSVLYMTANDTLCRIKTNARGLKFKAN